ncbi:ATP synthase subunit I [Antarcticimicrobium sediminis]|uniref:ATP synthase subunit I n=1 Tax=Antarcticimicrobium sediminis TaxID=2546227 RepID=A0A4R5F0P5_9RHOB|nr:ATP synthase subunit I [Antarcticimicrobium sediminis]TDE41055.1 ATP synthase subunit I [Antarcticimicrobium sediminis]
MDERTMIDLHTVPLFLILPVCFAGGIVLGVVHFRALRATADLLVRGERPFLGLALTLGRFIFLGVGLYVAVLAGGLALIVALAGILCAKAWMLRRVQAGNT